MRASRWITLTAVAVLSMTGTADAQRFPGSDDMQRSGFGANLTGGYTFLGGEVGDSIGGGFRLDGSAFYDFGETPAQVGAGGAYSWLGFDRLDGTLQKLSLFAFGTWKFADVESTMTPYARGRLGWTHLSDDQGCDEARCIPLIEGERTRSGLEVGAAIGVEYPVSARLSLDIGGGFDWINTGDAHLEGNRVDDGSPVSDTLPDSSQSGSGFTLYAGVMYFFSP